MRLLEFSKADIAAVSNALRSIGAEIDAILQALESQDFQGVFKIDGGKAVYRGLESISDWLGRLQHECRKQTLLGLSEEKTLDNPEKPAKKGKK